MDKHLRFGLFRILTGRPGRGFAAAVFFTAALPFAFAQAPGPPDPDDPESRLQVLGAVIQNQLRRGPLNKSEFTAYLEELGQLRGRLDKDEAKAEIGRVLILQAQIHMDVFEDCAKARESAEAFKTGYAKGADDPIAASLLVAVGTCEERQNTRASLVGQPAPNLQFAWTSKKGLKSLEDLSGKVVVLDFWVNSSQRSIGMFPMMRRLQDRFADLDVEIIGVTHPIGMIVGLRNQPMDFRGKPKKEIGQLRKYRKVQDITWTLAAMNERDYVNDYAITQYPSMAIIAPDGTIRHVNVGEDVAYLTRAEMVDRVLKDFGKPTSGLVR